MVGWTKQMDRLPAVRVAQEYAVQAIADTESFVISGPPAFVGLSGGPAIELATGRVVGVTVEYLRA